MYGGLPLQDLEDNDHCNQALSQLTRKQEFPVQISCQMAMLRQLQKNAPSAHRIQLRRDLENHTSTIASLHRSAEDIPNFAGKQGKHCLDSL